MVEPEPEVELGSEAGRFLRSELEVEPEPLLEVRARSIVKGRVGSIVYFVTSNFYLCMISPMTYD